MAKPRFYMKNWMEAVDVEQLKRQIGGRPVYCWSDKEYGSLEGFLKEHGIELHGRISENRELIGSSVYIIVTLNYRDEEVMAELRGHGLKENADFTYIVSYKTISYVDCYYSDNCGNEIIVDGKMENMEVTLRGYNNKLIIGKDCEFQKGCSIKMRGGAKLTFGDESYGKSGVIIVENSESIFEGDCWLADNFFISNFEGYMRIGKGMSALDGLYICVVENTRLTVGEDLMAAKDVKLLSGGAHSLFDLDLKENINIKDNIHVSIGNHVWLGMDSKVIYNTDIGDNSVVGAASLVKGSYPAHCLIAGSVARILRSNVDWERRDYVTFPEYEELLEQRKKRGH